MVEQIIQGDCLEKLKEFPDNSVDSICCDPPYELGFMGKSWDNTGIANNVEMWSECLRVLKPGGHLLSFGGTRTYHRIACAIEDAGFEVRDMVEWVYGSGFPKSRNIPLDMDKMEGHGNRGHRIAVANRHHPDGTLEPNGEILPAYIPKTENAIKWNGWGTALKPAHEPICMARKPLAEKTVAENVLKHGTGGINIDESRVESNEKIEQGRYGRGLANSTSYHNGLKPTERTYQSARFPANLIHDNSEEVRECFPETKSSKGSFKAEDYEEHETSTNFTRGDFNGRGDSGNASRFFKSIIYQPKASKGERNKGCEGLEEKIATARMNSSEFRYEEGREPTPRAEQSVNRNNHPTVKPIALMEYLIKMVTPSGGIVLDPFAGSGSTLVAAKQNGFQFIGIEKEPEYVKVIEARVAAAKLKPVKLL